MERTVITINAKNKREAIVCLETAYKVVKSYQNDSDAVSERVCITNEGESLNGQEKV